MKRAILGVLMLLGVWLGAGDNVWAWGGDAGLGNSLLCCGGDGGVKWWPDAVSRLAEQQGLDGAEAKRIYDDLIAKPYDELFLYSGELHPCDTYGECREEIPEEFFAKLVSLAMKYQEVELIKWQGRWATWAAVASAFFALVSLLGPSIGAVRRRRESKRL